MHYVVKSYLVYLHTCLMGVWLQLYELGTVMKRQFPFVYQLTICQQNYC